MLTPAEFAKAAQDTKYGCPVNMPTPAALLDLGIHTLAEYIGADNAAKPEWSKRIRVTREKPLGFLLAVTECGPLVGSLRGEDSPWMSSADPLASVQVFLPLAEAVELLKSPRNPEAVLARRKQLIELNTKEDAERRNSAIAQLRASARPASEGAQFSPDAWAHLNPTTQLLLRLAYAFEGDSKVAGELIHMADEAQASGGKLPKCPQRPWWLDLPSNHVVGG